MLSSLLSFSSDSECEATEVVSDNRCVCAVCVVCVVPSSSRHCMGSDGVKIGYVDGGSSGDDDDDEEEEEEGGRLSCVRFSVWGRSVNGGRDFGSEVGIIDSTDGSVMVGGVDAVWGARDEEWSVRTEDEGVVSADVVDVTVPGRLG